MEKFRRKKSKAPLVSEESQQVHRQRSTHGLASDFSSFDRSAIKEYSMARELDRSSSRLGSGLPIKKLLAEEMSKEPEANRRSPSVVARLMGFDGLPSQQTIHTQQKSSKSRTTSGIYGMRRNPYEYQSHKRCSVENPEFKDVYEVSEAKKCVKPNNSESEMNFIREKFMDAKRLSTYNRFHSSKEFFDTLNTLNTNKDLLIKFLQQPDSLYTKHLHDLHGDFAMYVSSRARPISEKCEEKNIDSKSKKGISRCNTRNCRGHLGSLSSNSYSPCSSNQSPNSSEIRSEEQYVTEARHTRIVVLKPNLEKVKNAKKPVSLHDRHMEYSDSVSEGKGQLGVKPLSCPNMRESRERAKAITRKMRKIHGNEPRDLPSIFQGYAGDESSYSVSGSESGSELEETILSSRKSFHWSKRRNTTSSSSRESSISREAKKRLCKRWNVSQRYRDGGSGGEISKLGEMLGKPDREMRRDKLDLMLVPDMSRGRFFVEDIMDLGTNLSNSCKDDRKERYIKNVSKSGFVSDSSVSSYSPELSTQCRTHDQGVKPRLKQPAYRERDKENKNIYVREDSSFRNKRSGNTKHQFPYSGDGADIADKCEFNFNVGEKITLPDVSLVSKIPISTANGPRLTTEAKVYVEHESKASSCGSPDEFSVKSSPCLSEISNSSAPGPEDSKQQIKPAEKESVPKLCSAPEIQSPASSKEADHSSPISVLKAPLTEDISSGSECFERVSADLHELRMQLKLLRIESGADGDSLVLRDKDDNRGSFSEIDENDILEYETWQTSYIDDILKESGFDSTDTNMIVAIWHSLECPISPWVFDKLEEKYFKDKKTLKSNRRLLFNRINLGIGEIFWWLVDPHPWVETGRWKVTLGWAKNGTRYELEKFLLSEENNTIEKMLDQEMEWFDFGDEIDDIGRELENLLINDLIDELVEMYVI